MDQTRPELMSSYSLIHSTPSQNLSDLVSQILETSSSMQDPPVQSNSLTPASPLHLQEISSSFSSPFYVETVTSALDSFTLNDEVFLGSHYYSRNEKTASSASEETGSSYTLESHSDHTKSSNSSDGIRGVWYYLTSSRDSSDASLSTTMPHSSTTSSSYSTKSSEESTASSGSVIELSSDSCRGVEDALRTDNQTPDTEIITLSDSSSSGSEFINISEERELESGTGEHLEESDPLKCDARCQTAGFNEDVLYNKAESGRRGSGPKNMGLKSDTGANGGDESTRGGHLIHNLVI